MISRKTSAALSIACQSRYYNMTIFADGKRSRAFEIATSGGNVYQTFYFGTKHTLNVAKNINFIKQKVMA